MKFSATKASQLLAEGRRIYLTSSGTRYRVHKISQDRDGHLIVKSAILSHKLPKRAGKVFDDGSTES